MASIFRQAYTAVDPKDPNKRIEKKSQYWYIDYKGQDGIRCRVKGYKDKAATAQLAATLEKEAERTDSGLIDRFKEHRKTPLAEHLKDFKQSLISGGASGQYADLKAARVERVFKACGFVFLPDISASRVQETIGGFRKTVETGKAGAQTVKDLGAISTQSKSHYLAACKSFCIWLVKDRRAADNPLSHLQAGRVVKTHPRRAMTADEISLLLDTTERGPERAGMTGAERSMLYRLAAETGLRAGELRALRVSDFELAGRMVTLAGEHTKNKKTASLPLRAETVERLRAFLAGKTPQAAVFNMPAAGSVSKVIQADLTAAKIDPADDETGKLDFHALRHSFASLLVQSGADIKTAQSLLRHSTPTLTLGIYTHTLRGSEQEAIDRLPGFDSGPKTEQQKATGTDGKAVETSPDLLTNQLTKSFDFSGHSLAMNGTLDRSNPNTGKTQKNSLSMTKTGILGQKTERERFELSVRVIPVRRFSKPLPENDKSLTDKGLRDGAKTCLQTSLQKVSGNTPADDKKTPPQTPCRCDCQRPELPPELAEIIDRWDNLPGHIRAAVMALIQTA